MNEKVLQVQLPSVRSLYCILRFGDQNLSTCTGFLATTATGHVLLTNRHNLTGRRNDTGEPLSKTGGVPDNILIFHHMSEGTGSWEGRPEPLYDSDGTPLWKEHPVYGSRADFVALPLTNVSGVSFYPYELSGQPAIAIAPGDVVSVVGFPFGMATGGLLPIWATGFIASEPEARLNGSDLPIFYVDCRSRPGQSGSAVIAHRSSGMVALESGGSVMYQHPVTRLLGIYSGRVNAESDIGIVWRTAALKELVDGL